MHKHSLVGFVSALGIALGSTGAMAGGWNDDDCGYCGRGYSSYYAPPAASCLRAAGLLCPASGVLRAARLQLLHARPSPYGYYAPRYRYGYGVSATGLW